MKTKHTPGDWRRGKQRDSVVTDHAPDDEPGYDQAAVDYYGGYLIAESIRECNIPLIAAAPKLLATAEAVVATAFGNTYGLTEADQLTALRLACEALKDAVAKAKETT